MSRIPRLHTHIVETSLEQAYDYAVDATEEEEA
jgi:hypothetical protein